MNYKKIKNLGELKKSNYHQKGIKDELRENLIQNIQNIYADFNSLNEELKSTMSIQTFYEKKWLKNEKSIKYLSFKIN